MYKDRALVTINVIFKECGIQKHILYNSAPEILRNRGGGWGKITRIERTTEASKPCSLKSGCISAE